MTGFFGQTLIIERDLFFLEKLHADLRLKDSPVMVTKTLKDAFALIRRPQNRIKAVFVSLSFGQVDVKEFFEKVKKIDAEMPLFVIAHNKFLTMDSVTMESLGVSSQLESPTGLADIIRVLDQYFPEKHMWDHIAPSEEQKNQELELSDADFMPIATEDFLLTEKCFFNVFIRLSKNKFLKILTAGDPFDSDFAEKYSEKKVPFLWVKKSEHLEYVHLAEKNTAIGIGKNSADVARRITHLGENVVQSLSRVGVSEDNLLYADRFLGHTVDYLRQLKFKDQSISKLFLELASTDHATAVSVMAGLLSQHLGLESSKAIKIVGLAALLHDVGLVNDRPDFPPELPDQLDGADLALYQRHAREGAEQLAKLDVLDEVIIQAVAQHHDKRSNHGGRATNMVSEIISASDLFCHTYLIDKTMTQTKFMEHHLKDYGPKIYDAFQAILRKKNSKKAV